MSAAGEKRAFPSVLADEPRNPKLQKIDSPAEAGAVAQEDPVVNKVEMENVAASANGAQAKPFINEVKMQDVPADPKQSKPKNPDVKTLFVPWKPEETIPPRFNDTWGLKPVHGQDGPINRPDEPPARTSNAQTKSGLWEDRKWRFKKGDRFVKSFGKAISHVPEDAELLDQQDNLCLNLIDMRPKSRRDPTPRRTPCYYWYDNGAPADWNNRQAIKALNDRRQQAIDRITMDAPWTNYERQYLAEIFDEYPNACIIEITERFNYRFMGKDFAKSTAFSWDYISDGRTIESVRHEYLTHKHLYDEGLVPQKKELEDKSAKGLAARKGRGNVAVKTLMAKFGQKDKDLDKDYDDSESEDEVGPNNKLSKNVAPKKKGKETTKRKLPSPADELLSDADNEELLQLAGYYSDHETAASATCAATNPTSPGSQDTDKSVLTDIEAMDTNVKDVTVSDAGQVHAKVAEAIADTNMGANALDAALDAGLSTEHAHNDEAKTHDDTNMGTGAHDAGADADYSVVEL